MCTTPLWPGTQGPSWLPLFESQLIRKLLNAITASSHSCSFAFCYPFRSLFASPLCNSEIWSVEMVFLQSSADTGNRVSLKLMGEEEPRIAVPVSKTTDIFLLLQHVCASAITWFISYCMPKHTITQYWVFRNTVLHHAFIVKKGKKICKNQMIRIESNHMVESMHLKLMMANMTSV